MGLRDTAMARCRVRGVMMSAKTDQSVMIVMIGSQGNCHKLITPTASREGKGCPTLLFIYDICILSIVSSMCRERCKHGKICQVA